MITSTPGHPVYVKGYPKRDRAKVEARRRQWYRGVDHRDRRTALAMERIGIVGYLLFVAAIAFIAFAIVSAAGDGTNALWWAIGAGAALLAGLGMLAFSRYLGTHGPPAGAAGRAAQDPLQPEISAEEADAYELRYHDTTREQA